MDTTFYCTYPTPLGAALVTATADALTGLWFVDRQLYLPSEKEQASWIKRTDLPVLQATHDWLNAYFNGDKPLFDLKLAPAGSDFRQAVWNLLLKIPYGQTTTYGKLASEVQIIQSRIRPPAAQAVGGAVGHNPISLVIPCHRVVGANGQLTGYGGGLDRKEALLKLEGSLT